MCGGREAAAESARPAGSRPSVSAHLLRPGVYARANSAAQQVSSHDPIHLEDSPTCKVSGGSYAAL